MHREEDSRRQGKCEVGTPAPDHGWDHQHARPLRIEPLACVMKREQFA